jgi:hypothetical protein
MPDPFFSDSVRAWLELARTLLVPVVAWAAMELRGVRLKLVAIEEWVKNHDLRDDERFDGFGKRMDRSEDRVEALSRQYRRYP